MMDEDTSQALLAHTEELRRLYAEDDMDRLNEGLKAAMSDLAGTKDGKMNFRGKLYATVALRIEMLRKHLGGDVSVLTEIVSRDESEVLMRAQVVYQDRVVATGYAEEKRSGKGVNSTSALENCETSAVGRALAALGLGGGEYASADELSGAVSAEKAEPEPIPDDLKKKLEDAAAGGRDAFGAVWQEVPKEQRKLVQLHPSFLEGLKQRAEAADREAA